MQLVRFFHLRGMLALLVALYLGILIWQAGRVGLTVDEPTRLLTGYLYWKGLHDHDPKDQPPLLSIVTGWAPLALDMPLYPDDPVWKEGAWKDHISSFIFDQMPGPAIDRIVFLARLGVLIFPLLTLLILWRWASELFPVHIAVSVVVLYLLLPSFRGHSALITSDLAASFAYLWFGYECWRYLRDATGKNLVRLGVASGVALIAKFSLVFAPLLGGAVVLYVAFRDRKLLYLLRPAAVLVLALLISILAYKFDTRRLTDSDLESMRAGAEFPEWVIDAAWPLQVIPSPADLQQGIRALGRNQNEGNPVYLSGEVYPNGHWLYFPLTLALKIPIAFQILAVLGIGVLALGCFLRILPANRLWLLLPPVLYLLIAMQSSVQLGIRLIFPALIFFVLITGFAIDFLWRYSSGRIVLAVLLGFLLVSTARIFPHDISYFNEWAGGPENGWRYLSDSNIDWGHNLPDLRDYMSRTGVSTINLFSFGYDKLHRYFPPGAIRQMRLPWSPAHVESTVFQPPPGLYAVHVSLLGGQLFPPGYRDYLAYFRSRQPIARPGFGIAVYRVP